MKFKSLKKLKLCTVLIFILGALSMQSQYAEASRQFPLLYVNEKQLEIRASVTYNGTTLVPFRAIFEEFDMDVSWDNDNKSVTATNETTTIVLTNNSYTGYVNGVEYQLRQVPSISRSGEMDVNLRFIAEALGYQVVWEKTETDAIIYIKD